VNAFVILTVTLVPPVAPITDDDAPHPELQIVTPKNKRAKRERRMAEQRPLFND
jgi:hypothetical protein